jgi:hypothetical protein
VKNNQEQLRKIKHKVLWQESNLRPCDFGEARYNPQSAFSTKP